jgi:hypothetical protein
MDRAAAKNPQQPSRKKKRRNQSISGSHEMRPQKANHLRVLRRLNSVTSVA